VLLPTVVFEYVAVTFSSITPVYGPVAGSTAVTIRGSSLGLFDKSLLCAFGNANSSTAVTISRDEVRCLTPVTKEAGGVGLRLHSNGATCGESVFQFLDRVLVSQIHPGYGPVDGGTKVM